MLEVRYNTETKELTGWCADPEQFGYLKDRGNEVVVVLDIPIPDKPMEAWLFDEVTQTLIPNPDYVEPEPPRDLAQEINGLKARVKELEIKGRIGNG